MWIAGFLRDIERWIAYRTYDRYDTVYVPELRGHYCDKDILMLHANFQILVDFVEVESAWMHNLSSRRFRWPFSKPSSIEDGLAHLDWEISLKQDESMGVHQGEEGYGESTSQAKHATEVKTLYLWWARDRPNRPDPYADWTDVYESLSQEDKSTLAMKVHEIEEAQHQEDEDMLIRLMKVRRGLWT